MLTDTLPLCPASPPPPAYHLPTYQEMEEAVAKAMPPRAPSPPQESDGMDVDDSSAHEVVAPRADGNDAGGGAAADDVEADASPKGKGRARGRRGGTVTARAYPTRDASSSAGKLDVVLRWCC